MATITTAHPASASSLKQAIVRHPLVAYFVLAFAGTWGVQRYCHVNSGPGDHGEQLRKRW